MIFKSNLRQIDLQNQNPHHKAKQKSVQVMGAGTENKVSFNNYFVTNWLREKVIFNYWCWRSIKWI